MIQLGTIDRIATLSDLGAMDYRLDTLQTKYDMLLADNEFMQPNFMMTAVDIDAIRATAPAIQQHIATLDALNLPDILLHCDFQALNVAIKDNRVIIFDWTDASIGNPLVDLAAMELFAAEKFSGTPDTVAQLRKAYFSEFEAFASQEVLHQASHSARVISNVLQAVNYHHLLRAIEPEERWVLNMIPKYLLTIVQLLDSD